jgi:UDP-N-acetylglucosamine--N-acetylmuramyl-(pentapeptide) pyrophosphoryl-undecaprenol N-acetylglucosamine transferase
MTQPLIIIAAGGTGGHIFPALSVALQLRRDFAAASLLWIGTNRSREVELCALHSIPITVMAVTGIERKVSLAAARSLLRFIAGFFRSLLLFLKKKPTAVVAFGGYVCAPVLAAARLFSVRYFIHEQNTVPGLVNRIFAPHAQKVFTGLPLSDAKKLGGSVETTGTPVRRREETYDRFAYPAGFDRAKRTILVCGGSQGAKSMNECLMEPVARWAAKGCQVVWQSGEAGYRDVFASAQGFAGVFVRATIDDLYPYYDRAQVVVGRAGASTIAEIAYFGLPCVLIPLPWAADNHQWTNAGVVEEQGWGIRVRQDASCGVAVDAAVMKMLGDDGLRRTMRSRALTQAPSAAAETIARKVMEAISL